ncbi:MAG: serine/threonine-protein kinase [Planctomycetota bacterium]
MIKEPLDPVEAMDFEALSPAAPHAEAADASPRAAARFLHASGSRPLSGYTIKRGVGQGGFGEIYYAVSDAGKEVALKLVRRNLDVELRGIRHCLNLKHPNLLDLYDIRQDDGGDTWVVMEYVGGPSLESALAANPQGMPADVALRWLQGIAAGVAYLHDHGIVHRDLKPGNVFMTDGLVKVGDYGLSKFISCSRRSGHTESIGTVHYMAPEVANGRYGKEIDVYALGVMLYEMLTGRVPFDGESVGEVLMKHLTAQPDVSVLAEPFRSVLARALEKDPEQRFHSVEEMMAALPTPVAAPKGFAYDPAADFGARASRQPDARWGAGHRRQPRMADTVAHSRGGPLDDEPIWRTVRDTWHRVQHGWREANLPTPLKFMILVALVLALFMSAQVLVPFVVTTFFLYSGYVLIRLLVLGARGAGPVPGMGPPREVSAGTPKPVQAPSPAAAAVAVAQRAPDTRRGWRHEKSVSALVIKTPAERGADLLGAMLVSALATGGAGVVMMLVAALAGARMESIQPTQWAWLLLTSLFGSWAVLVPAKFWEGTRGEPRVRRLVQMCFGLATGVFAASLASILLLDLPEVFGILGLSDEFKYRLPESFYAPGGEPRLLAFMAAFGSLFFVMRWWKLANPLRGTRLSLWSIFITVIVADVLAALWHFPEPWLPMVAATMAISVQLASPWVNQSVRCGHRSNEKNGR